MLDRMALGELPPKPHTVLRNAEGALCYEECLTRTGFDGPFSILYHRNRPQAWVREARELSSAALQPSAAERLRAHAAVALTRRHYRTRALSAGGTLLSARTPLLENADVLLAVDRFIRPMPGARVWKRITYQLGQLGIIAGVLLTFSA